MARESDEERIRRKAHELWEAEGRPHGRDRDHWIQAREIIAIEDSQADTLLPRTTGAEPPIEPALVAENYDEMPDLTDQGRDDLTDISREPPETQAPATRPGDTTGAVARPSRAPNLDPAEPTQKRRKPAGSASLAASAKPAATKPVAAKPAANRDKVVPASRIEATGASPAATTAPAPAPITKAAGSSGAAEAPAGAAAKPAKARGAAASATPPLPAPPSASGAKGRGRRPATH